MDKGKWLAELRTAVDEFCPTLIPDRAPELTEYDPFYLLEAALDDVSNLGNGISCWW